MPNRTPCRFCQRVGFVRIEHVLKGGKSLLTFYCGACNRAWETEESTPRPDQAGDRSKTSGQE